MSGGSWTHEWAPGTVHGHLAAVSLADGYKTGLAVRPAFGRTLKEVYGSDEEGFVALHDMITETMEDAGREHGIERDVKHDEAARQLRDIRGDVEALGPTRCGIDWEDGDEQSFRDVRDGIADARDRLEDARGELAGVYQDIDQAREDLR
jgi:hypothetical protein